VSFSIYRVVRAIYPPFDGSGAARFGARWTSPGREAIYAAQNYAGALLEILAHARRANLQTAYHCMVIHVPEDLAITTVHADHVPGWDAGDYLVSRAVGDAWLDAGATALLDVPSVLGRPYERNVVINPHHPDAHRLVREEPHPVEWDTRLSHL